MPLATPGHPARPLPNIFLEKWLCYVVDTIQNVSKTAVSVSFGARARKLYTDYVMETTLGALFYVSVRFSDFRWQFSML